MKIALVALLGFATALNAFATPADEQFQTLAGAYIENGLKMHPEYATELGDHRFDALLTDYSPDSRAKELAEHKALLEKLNSFEGIADLTGANKVDFRILKENVEGAIFELEELKEADWNPLTYNQSLAQGLYVLIAREFAPPAERAPTRTPRPASRASLWKKDCPHRSQPRPRQTGRRNFSASAPLPYPSAKSRAPPPR